MRKENNMIDSETVRMICERLVRVETKMDTIWQIGMFLSMTVIGTLFTNVWQLILLKKNGNGNGKKKRR